MLRAHKIRLYPNNKQATYISDRVDNSPAADTARFQAFAAPARLTKDAVQEYELDVLRDVYQRLKTMPSASENDFDLTDRMETVLSAYEYKNIYLDTALSCQASMLFADILKTYPGNNGFERDLGFFWNVDCVESDNHIHAKVVDFGNVLCDLERYNAVNKDAFLKKYNDIQFFRDNLRSKCPEYDCFIPAWYETKLDKLWPDYSKIIQKMEGLYNEASACVSVVQFNGGIPVNGNVVDPVITRLGRVVDEYNELRQSKVVREVDRMATRLELLSADLRSEYDKRLSSEIKSVDDIVKRVSDVHNVTLRKPVVDMADYLVGKNKAAPEDVYRVIVAELMRPDTLKWRLDKQSVHVSHGKAGDDELTAIRKQEYYASKNNNYQYINPDVELRGSFKYVKQDFIIWAEYANGNGGTNGYSKFAVPEERLKDALAGHKNGDYVVIGKFEDNYESFDIKLLRDDAGAKTHIELGTRVFGFDNVKSKIENHAANVRVVGALVEYTKALSAQKETAAEKRNDSEKKTEKNCAFDITD